MIIQTTNPATGELIKEYTLYDDQKVEEALSLSEETFKQYRTRPLDERIELILRVEAYLLRHKAQLASLMTQEMGKLYSASLSEVEKCAGLCRYYADHAYMFLQDQKVDVDASRSFIRYLPIGPVLAVMPWNFPLWQVFRFAIPTLIAGNTGVLKHASNVSGCALAIEEIFHACGFDRGAFQTLLIGSDKVASIIADARIRAVTLTGSEYAGSAVAMQAGKHIKKTVLELGGSDPFIVMPSADLGMALDLAVIGRVQNNGQTCIAAKRYIIHENIYDVFKENLIARYQALKVGSPMEEGIDIGPLATPQILKEIVTQVDETIAMGGVKLCGGDVFDGPGNFYRPALLEDIPVHSPAYQGELFGPVGLLFKVSDMDEAIQLANDTRFGLSSVLCSQNEVEIEAAINELDCGATFINALTASHPALPFGGVKYSGYGRELSALGLYEFMNAKTIVAQGI
ncbi:MAG: NAD-dependent succinate-semialdehyde dehydrogenase [Alphaproteobacteria bacterium]